MPQVGTASSCVPLSAPLVRILMPGADIAQIHDLSAGRRYVGDNAWWWSDTVARAASTAL